MKQYLDLVKTVLTKGQYKTTRTGIDTISYFAGFHKIDLSEGFPLLTTKKMDGFRWKSLIHELLWYFSGEDHIRNLQQHTKIWNPWADEQGNLGPVYGVQWRRAQGVDYNTGELVEVDQLQNAIDLLKTNPNSRRIIITAWNPAQINKMGLPPCHHTFTFNVLDGKLNCHLDQRSCDVALGVPFNIAGYSMLTKILAQETGLEPGEFAHTLVDLHAYCGDGKEFGLGKRGLFYKRHLPELQERMRIVQQPEDYLEIRKWIKETAPEESKKHLDHIPGLLLQLSRTPKKLPKLDIATKPFEKLTFDDFVLQEYESYKGIKFAIAE
jgi:thymidylate synthase